MRTWEGRLLGRQNSKCKGPEVGCTWGMLASTGAENPDGETWGIQSETGLTDPGKEVEFSLQATGNHRASGAGGGVRGFHFSADPSDCYEEEGWLAREEPGGR